jgi:hypothetical protein
MKVLNSHYFNAKARQILVLLSLSIVFVLSAAGQTTDQTIDTGNDETRPGRLLSEGNNNAPVGNLKVLTYKLEEIRPPRPVRLKYRETSITGFRLTITAAEKLTGGSYRVWIDDNSYSAFMIGLYKIGVVLHSPDLPNGARLAISSLGVSGGEYVAANVSALPERLFVPPPYGYNASDRENQNRYVLKRVPRFIRATNQTITGVEIQISGDNGFPAGEGSWIIQIGETDHYAELRDGVLILWFKDQDFSRLRDGDKIKVRYGSGPFVNATVVGRLNKNLIR